MNSFRLFVCDCHVQIALRLFVGYLYVTMHISCMEAIHTYVTTKQQTIVASYLYPYMNV